ncbi:hypothetical protein DBR40_09085 [Pedobacter sp. KBW01]|uniref:hypothetical protein n=1 Tax=Pedobacter sp. KBW01 TaxID=2153364 RepID=UPI000F5979CF|nr:hypothetical protein [Pedobacter sp. KBW01]RQO78093.1 hypothetical protein DBR40_09085 [Pedobacter sp. KBW01]
MTLKEQISWCKSEIKKGNNEQVLRSILKRLEASDTKEPPHPYHNEAVAAYKDFLKAQGLPPLFDFKQGKALKELLIKLQNVTASRSPEGALGALKFIFEGWNRLSDYHKKKKTLVHINNNVVEILDLIRYGATKQQTNLDAAQQLANAIKGKRNGGSQANSPS